MGWMGRNGSYSTTRCTTTNTPVPERGELWQDVGMVGDATGTAGAGATATTAPIAVRMRQAPIVDEALVEDGLVVDVL